MPETKTLGKITSFKFGINEWCMGSFLTLSCDGCCVNTNNVYNCTKHTEYSKWTPEDQKDWAAKALMTLHDWMEEAQVSDVSEMVGIPVEVTWNGNLMKSWRILTEVI